MDQDSPSARKYGLAFCVVLQHFAKSTTQGRWFLINHDDDADPNTLANFLHIRHAELVALLHQVGIMRVFGKTSHFNRQAMITIIHGIEEAEYTKTRLSYDDSKPRDYHLI